MLYGSWRSGLSYRALDIQIVPCATRYVAYDGSVSEDDGSCEWDIEKSKEYLGSALTIVILSNEGAFNAHNYDEKRVSYKSKINSSIASTEKANWTGSFINKHEL